MQDKAPLYAMVVGGANLDIKARIDGATIPATSNPGQAMVSVGGVGRNIAHNLVRLGITAKLISVVGDDPEGDRLLRETAAAGVDIAGVRRVPATTGLYTAVLDSAGELVIGVAAMDILRYLTPAELERGGAAIDNAAFLVADCNLSQDCLAWLQSRAAHRAIPLLIEPVSAPKAARLAQLLARGLPLHTVTPNRKQLEILAGHTLESMADFRRAVEMLHARNVGHVLVGLGAEGALLSSADGFHRIPAAVSAARDVTGGGDALVAGYIAAILQNRSAPEAALFGQAVAGLTVAASDSVSPAIDPDRLWRDAAALQLRMEVIPDGS